jgi:hypothetical protein
VKITKARSGLDPTTPVNDQDQDRYTILGYASTAAKHGIDKITALRDALAGRPWLPALPAPT